MKKKYVLKNKRRFYSILLTLSFMVITALFATNAYGYKTPLYKEITVRSGDSLWSIAKKYNPQGDVRKFIYEIQKVNDLTSSDLFVGKQLKIPV